MAITQQELLRSSSAKQAVVTVMKMNHGIFTNKNKTEWNSKWTITKFSKYTSVSREVIGQNTFPWSKFSLRGATRATYFVDLAHREEC